MGADLERYLSVFNTAKGTIDKTADDIAQGTYIKDDIRTTNNGNATATTINQTLDQNQQAGGTSTNNGLSL